MIKFKLYFLYFYYKFFVDPICDFGLNFIEKYDAWVEKQKISNDKRKEETERLKSKFFKLWNSRKGKDKEQE